MDPLLNAANRRLIKQSSRAELLQSIDDARANIKAARKEPFRPASCGKFSTANIILFNKALIRLCKETLERI